MKQYIILGASLLSLLAAGCSNENVVIENVNDTTTGKPITLKAAINNDASTRMTYEFSESVGIKLAWSNQETFNLYQGTSSDAAVFSKNVSGSTVNAEDNTFTGYAPNGTGAYYAVYGDNITNTEGKLTVNISNQTGTVAKNGITNFMVAQTTDLTQTLYFDYKLTVMKLTLTLPSDATGTVKRVAISGLHNHATYTLDGGIYSYDDGYKLPIEARNGSTGFTIDSNHAITAFVAVFPEIISANTVTIKAETSSNDLYYYTIRSNRQLDAGKVVPMNVTLTKVVPEYVDLGLPSRTLWATMNMGAVSPEDYGDYYAWGETDTKDDYSWDSYLCVETDCGGDNDPLKEYYYPDQKSIAFTKYDVAHMKWGSKWRIPTRDQIEELYDESNCNKEWTTDYLGNGTNIAGWILTSKKTSKSIFLPAAGYRAGSELYDQGEYGNCWSSLPVDNGSYAFSLSFLSDQLFWRNFYRFSGLSVRPVYIPNPSSSITDYGTVDDSDFNQ